MTMGACMHPCFAWMCGHAQAKCWLALLQQEELIFAALSSRLWASARSGTLLPKEPNATLLKTAGLLATTCLTLAAPELCFAAAAAPQRAS